jgi:hypothetical protein
LESALNLLGSEFRSPLLHRLAVRCSLFLHELRIAFQALVSFLLVALLLDPSDAPGTLAA